ncbi:MAG: hypothetical protein HRT68_07465 [Flavobacteriaceae bacterium]|nr:hypothetical protein [Flavobacteriaceae bacterium]
MICNDCNFWTYQKIDTCCREPFTIIAVHQQTNKSFSLFKQCVSCGGTKAPLDLNEYSDDIQTQFSLHRFNEWKDKVAEEYQLLAKLKAQYYLQHTQWHLFNELKVKPIIIPLDLFEPEEIILDKPKVIHPDFSKEEPEDPSPTVDFYSSQSL